MSKHYVTNKVITQVSGIPWLFIFVLTLVIVSSSLASAETYQFIQQWPATKWSFSSPMGIAVDAAGNVLVADTSYHRIQKFDSAGILINTFGSYGSGNGQFYYPVAVAADASGNIYVVDNYNNRIQKFNSSGVFISTWGSYGSGNGQFAYPQGVAVDSSGNVYVADSGNKRIQKFNSAGVFISTWGSYGSGDGQFYAPSGVAVDSSGNVYVTDTGGNNRIQKFDSSGVFISKWGSSGSGDGQFSYASGIAVDASGNVYVADTYNNRIQKFTSGGVFIGKWGSSGSGDGQFISPYDVAVDGSGNVYVVDTSNHRIQKFDSGGVFISMWWSWGTGNGQFYYPRGVAIDPSGNVYVADTYNNRIQKFTSSGTFIGTWGSSGSGNGQFIDPNGVSVDASGNVYVADTYNNRIQKFTSSGTFISTWGSYGSGNGQFAIPQGVAVDGSGNVYVSDNGNHRIQKFTSSGTFIGTWGSYGSGNGQFKYPNGIAVDASGSVYVVDFSNNRIQKFTSGGTFITTWGSYGNGNGQFANPRGVAVDASGNVYVSDYGNHRIQKFTSGGTFITTWGSYGTGNSQFIYPEGVAVDTGGYVYVVDSYNHRIQKFGLACVDNDGDGYGSPGALTCPNGDVTDCDDNNASINPGATEVCNGIDDNCNAQIDEGVENTYYADADSDTYGNPSAVTEACTQPSGYVTNNLDCDDGDAFINPSVAEVCNGVDDNCNVLIDEGVQNTYYEDFDSDTYGNAFVTTLACTPPSGYVTDDTDCDDSSASIYPGALEVCNGVDDNCNTQIDENVTYPYYADADGDGYGDPANSTQACSQPTGYVSDNTDCDDSDPATYPGAVETPNDGIDQDCNGVDLAVEALINGAGGNQQSHTVAWNPMVMEYLVLWQDFRNGGTNPDIYGVRLDAHGNVVSADIPVVTHTAKQAGPWVAHGTYGGDYLAVWVDQRNMSTTGTDVYGAWISDGGTAGSEFVITNAPSNQRAASVVYNPDADNFLVTWIDDTNGVNNTDVWGAIVSHGGGAGSPFAMVTETGNQRGPYVRYDYGNGHYFMVWFDNRNGNYDVYGSRVSAAGAAMDGGGLLISGATGNQKNPRFADRDPLNGIGNYVFAWVDDRNGQKDIYGALVDGSGTNISGDIVIAGGASAQVAASVDVDWFNTKLAVVSWADDVNGTDYDIYRAEVDQTGTVSMPTAVAGQPTGTANNQQGPLVTYSEDNGIDNGFLFLWRDNRSGVDYDLYGIKVWP